MESSRVAFHAIQTDYLILLIWERRETTQNRNAAAKKEGRPIILLPVGKYQDNAPRDTE